MKGSLVSAQEAYLSWWHGHPGLGWIVQKSSLFQGCCPVQPRCAVWTDTGSSVSHTPASLLCFLRVQNNLVENRKKKLKATKYFFSNYKTVPSFFSGSTQMFT